MPILLQGGLVVTMNARRDMFDGGYVAVGDDGAILAVGPGAQAPVIPGARVVDVRGMVVVPGLIDACQVLSRNLLAGPRAAHAGRAAWEYGHFAARHMGAGALADAARVTAHALLRGGTTCMLNLLPTAERAVVTAVVEATHRAGLRQVQALPFAQDADPSAVAGRLDALIRSWADAGCGDLAQPALQVCSSAFATLHGQAGEASMTAAYALARSAGLKIVTRSSSADGADLATWQHALQAAGRSEFLHLMELGLLDERWLLVGAEAMQPADLALVRESGCAMVCTPLASASRGLAPGPWPELLRAGVRCALGTDPGAPSPATDMLEQMKSCVLVHNAARLDATALSSETVLEMATIDAAAALGIDGLVGSLEEGKRADIAVFDLRGVHTQVAHKPLSLLVACAGATDAAWVMVDGRFVVQDGQLAHAAQAGDATARCLQHARGLQVPWAAMPATMGGG